VKTYQIAVVAGDGIGPEVIGETRKVLERAGQKFGFSFEWREFPYGAKHYLATGETNPEEGIAEMEKCNAMLLGAIGDPSVKPGILEHGILLALRFRYDQYVNLRPALSFPRVPTPVPLGGTRIDSVVVRENTEDLYMGIGGNAPGGSMNMPINVKRGAYDLTGGLKLMTAPACPFAGQVAVNTRPSVERITRYACNLAKKRGEKRVTVVSKSNAVSALYGFFEDVAKDVMAKEFPELEYAMVNVDALCYHLVRTPAAYGVLLCPNLFGDIISDLQAGLAGGLGTAAGGNIGDGLSMFEPVHGSAPDIAGTGRANPIAAILSGGLLLQHLGELEASAAVNRAVTEFLEQASEDELPFEFGGKATFSQVGDKVAGKL
jgi:3-isopropylmalate dehydrogenase